jgi:hypothetical protein
MDRGVTLKSMLQANGKPVKFLDGCLKPLRSRAFEIGFKDTMHGIKTFPVGGTDKFKTLSDYKKEMLAACDNCQDSEYSAGVKEAFRVGGSMVGGVL